MFYCRGYILLGPVEDNLYLTTGCSGLYNWNRLFIPNISDIIQLVQSLPVAKHYPLFQAVEMYENEEW